MRRTRTTACPTCARPFPLLKGYDDRPAYLPLTIPDPASDSIYPQEGPDASWRDDHALESERPWSSFLAEAGGLAAGSLQAYFEALLDLVQRYTWAVPSAHYRTLPDVSLYDHCRMTAALDEAFEAQTEVDFEGVPFTVEARTADEETSPWAGHDTYRDVAARHLRPSRPAPEPSFHFLLASPTAFQSQGRTIPLPLPGPFFGSLVKRWNAFALQGWREVGTSVAVVLALAAHAPLGAGLLT